MNDTRQLPDDTRQRIVDTARQLFHERGYSAVGVADICRKARVVKGSFYHFFPSKEELLAETLRRNWRQLDALLDGIGERACSGRESIALLFEAVLAEARRTQRECGQVLGCRIGTTASELHGGAAPGAGQDALDAWRRRLRKLVRNGQADGSIDAGADATAVADALLASIQGMSVLGRALQRPAVLKRIAEVAMQQVPEPR